jgi:hypothetical protein
VPLSCRRDLFVTGPGPDAGGTSHGSDPWRHVPEKSGTDPALGLIVSAGEATAGVDCPAAGPAVAANVNTVADIRKFSCTFMPTSHHELLGMRARRHLIPKVGTAHVCRAAEIGKSRPF